MILKNVNKRFGEKEVLKNFSCSFAPGTWTLITGPSGCGKTTLFRILLGLEKVDTGDLADIPERFSVVFQENRLCEEFTVLDNLRLVSDASAFSIEETDTILTELELLKEKNQKVSELSGGMKRRCAIARAVLVKAEAYLLDEPFYGLDQNLKKKTMDFLIRHLKNKTVILITHDSDAVTYLEQTGVVDQRLGLEP